MFVAEPEIEPALRGLPKIHAASDLLELARNATAAQLERILRAFRRVEAGEAKRVAEHAHLGYCWEEDGSLQLRARLAPEDGTAFLNARDVSRDALRAER